jgi:hypothetical protein
LKKANKAMRSAYNVLNGINFMTHKGTPNRVETAVGQPGADQGTKLGFKVILSTLA